MLITLPRHAIIAHRGASAYAPENTLAAFELAVRQGADMIELDVKLSADKHVVVIHDSTLDRTTNGTGKVAETRIQEIKTLDAGSCFDVTFKDERIPTLSEVFESVGNQIFINVELTNYTTPLDDLPEQVAELVKDHNIESRLLFSSFNPVALRKMKKYLPESPVALLAQRGFNGAFARSILANLQDYQALHPHFSDVNTKLLNRQHHVGRKVFAYTVNQASQMESLFQLGIDGIFTDDPVLAQQVLDTL